jgi:hypothetical protein
MAGMQYYVRGDYDYVRSVVDQVLTDNGFKLNYSDSYNLQAERGSVGMTLMIGAFSGKNQHMKLSANYAVDQQGTQVLTFRQANTGAAGGIIGHSRISEAFFALANQIGAIYSAQDNLLGQQRL